MQYSFTVNCGTLIIMRRPGFQIRFPIFLVSAADVNAYKSWSFEKAENKKKESPSYDPNPSFMFSHDLVLNSLVPPPECWSGSPLGGGLRGRGEVQGTWRAGRSWRYTSVCREQCLEKVRDRSLPKRVYVYRSGGYILHHWRKQFTFTRVNFYSLAYYSDSLLNPNYLYVHNIMMKYRLALNVQICTLTVHLCKVKPFWYVPKWKPSWCI